MPEIRVASVPSGHVYVRHLSDPDGPDGVTRVPAEVDARWVTDHHDDFDVFHLHAGFDDTGPAGLAEVVDALRRHGRPLVCTVHELRDPRYRTRLDVVVPAADALITLTAGAAWTIADTWGRPAEIIPHPHVVEPDEIPVRREHPYAIGVPAAAPGAAPVIEVLREVVAGLPDAHLHPAVGTDAEPWQPLSELDLVVLPCPSGSHSTLLEACHDLGTTVLAPSGGFYAQQRPCLTYRHDETGLDADELTAAVLLAHDKRPDWRADPGERRRERRRIARRHKELYSGLR